MNKYPMLIKVEKVNGKLVAFDSQGNDKAFGFHIQLRKTIQIWWALLKESEDSKFRSVRRVRWGV